jgi:Flp pilus assembly pilin Flp
VNQAPRAARAAVDGVVANERGSVTVEYAVLLGVVSIGCVFAIIGLGMPLVRMYQANQIWLQLPIP